ncbi:hypothetical protein BOX15_Mlig031808g1 [Macrostomum lignano]|uniref:PX domain-containing protein n=1 Tax=Macrostomum lignano TaxID=282301 RepID=A0A267DVK9_9PLAT|nr:hypothetical protein BOX15_Mlig031808g1 [Macrostomum lignano]
MASLIDEFGKRRVINIQVIGFDFSEGYINYEIEICIANVCWLVRRRFSEFFALHQTLCSQRAFEMRSLSPKLPPKKASLGGNLSTRLAEERQRALSIYLQALVGLFDNLPMPLVRFLLWDKYEVQGITASLTEYLFEKGSAWLASGHAFEFSVVQVYAVNKRMEIAAPTCQPGRSFRSDFGHLLEFIASLEVAGLYGSPGRYGSSDLPVQQLPVSLAPFRSLRRLQLTCVRPGQLTGLDRLPLTELQLRRCSPVDAGKDCWTDDAELSRLLDQLPRLERLSADAVPTVRLLRLLGPQRAARIRLNGRLLWQRKRWRLRRLLAPFLVCTDHVIIALVRL